MIAGTAVGIGFIVVFIMLGSNLKEAYDMSYFERKGEDTVMYSTTAIIFEEDLDGCCDDGITFGLSNEIDPQSSGQEHEVVVIIDPDDVDSGHEQVPSLTFESELKLTNRENHE